jgi:transposase
LSDNSQMFTKKIICPTSLSDYIKEIVGELHGHQIKGISDFVFAIIEQRTAVQAGLAEVFGNQEAAGKRLSRLLQNPRISSKQLSELVFEQTLKQLSKVGKVRLAFDWTIENKQYLLVISLVRNGRAIPIFWRGYEEQRLKNKMKLIERAMLKRVLKRLKKVVGKRRIILTADRGFACVKTFRLLKTEKIGFVIRVKCNTLIWLKGEWKSLKSIELEADGERKKIGTKSYCRSDEESLEIAVSCVKASDEGKDRWYLVSNLKWSAEKMVDEYRRRFWCEEGFRDVKWTLGFAKARIKQIKAWTRMFGLHAIAMLVLASVESEILLKDEKQGREKMREVASRRKGGWSISLINATIKLLKRDRSLYNCLNPFIKLNLCNTLQ